MLVPYIKGFIKYMPLLKELVIRDIKTRYRRSMLGLLWTLLNPLLTMLVLTFVFSTLFRNNIQNFSVYLICGQTVFSFFTESTNNAMHSIVGGSSLIRKIYIPKYLFPLSKILSACVNLLASIIALIGVMLATGVSLTPAMLLLVFPVVYIFLFSFGMGLILSSVAMFFRDTIHFYGVLTTLWMYMTPIFYPFDILPPQARAVVQLNPLTNIVEFVRFTVLYGAVPPLQLHVVCLLPGIVFVAVGLWVFFNTQDRFILHM